CHVGIFVHSFHPKANLSPTRHPRAGLLLSREPTSRQRAPMEGPQMKGRTWSRNVRPQDRLLPQSASASSSSARRSLRRSAIPDSERLDLGTRLQVLQQPRDYLLAAE